MFREWLESSAKYTAPKTWLRQETKGIACTELQETAHSCSGNDWKNPAKYTLCTVNTGDKRVQTV